MSDEILVEREGGIATVVFNRPKVRNAVSLAMWGEIANVTEALSRDDAVRAIVYRGAGRDAFAVERVVTCARTVDAGCGLGARSTGVGWIVGSDDVAVASAGQLVAVGPKSESGS